MAKGWSKQKKQPLLRTANDIVHSAYRECAAYNTTSQLNGIILDSHSSNFSTDTGSCSFSWLLHEWQRDRQARLYGTQKAKSTASISQEGMYSQKE